MKLKSGQELIADLPMIIVGLIVAGFISAVITALVR